MAKTGSRRLMSLRPMPAAAWSRSRRRLQIPWLKSAATPTSPPPGGGRGGEPRGRKGQISMLQTLSRQNASTDHHRKWKNIRITIPKGPVEDGRSLPKGHGQAYTTAVPAGDGIPTFKLQNDTGQRGQRPAGHAGGYQISTSAVLGAMTLDTLHGKIKRKVKPETQNGTKAQSWLCV